MPNYPKLVLKMNTYLSSFYTYFEQVIHPAAGKDSLAKQKKRPAHSISHVRATPDCLNIRDLVRTKDGFRRNPAP